MPQGPAGYPWPAYGQPMPPQYPPTALPGYPPPGTPPAYPPGHLWAAPATTPMAPWPPAPGWYPPSAPQVPTQPPRKSRTGLIVGSIIALVLVLCVSAGALLYVAASRLPAASVTIPNPPTQPPQATPTPAGPAVVVYQNSLTTPSGEWTDDGTSCFFKADGYHITNNTICFAPSGEETNVYVSVHVKQIRGTVTQSYGIAIRSALHAQTGYDFFIDSNGKWGFDKCGGDTCTNLVDYTSHPAIHTGLNTVNSLEVRATGSHFDFFVNNTKVGQADDSAIQSGYVGLEAGDNIECVFTDLTVSRPS